MILWPVALAGILLMSRRSWGSRRFLFALAGVVAVLSLLIVLPYLQFVLLAVLLAYVLDPVNDRLARRFGSTLAAAATMLFATAVILVPVALALVTALRQADSVVERVQALDAETIAGEVTRRTGIEVEVEMVVSSLSDVVENGLRGAAGNVVTIVGGIPELLIGITVFGFVLFYLLRDGDRLVGWLRGVLPLEPELREELFAHFDRLMWAGIVGTAVVAFVQALLTVVAFVPLGFGNVAFWFVITFVLSLLPLVGASVVWLPAVGFLALVGQPVEAGALLVYGAVVISGSDNVLRPLIVNRGAALNPATIVLGIFGGVAVFGVVGLFFGPIVLGMLKIVVELLVRDATVGSAGTPAVAADRTSQADTSPSDERSGDAPATDRAEPEDDRDGTAAGANPNADAADSPDAADSAGGGRGDRESDG